MHASLAWLLLSLGAVTAADATDSQNVVANGSFEESRPGTRVPDKWSVSGHADVKQQLSLDTGRDGSQCGKFVCTEFVDGGPSHHAMVCQTGQIGLQRGKWYRLAFWAKGRQIKEGTVEVAISNTATWENGGLADAFLPRADWERFEFRFRAAADVPAASSRLQFWFKSSGTLWLDDVTLTETTDSQQWLPAIATSEVKNFVPNSSFECGGANWGSFTWGLRGWGGNLYRLEGQVCETAAPHGTHCLQIALNPDNYPVYWFDYYDPVRQPIQRVLVANQGWFQVEPGEPLTLSAWLRADAENVAAELAVNEAPSRLQHKQVRVGTQWQRYAFTFRPSQPYLFIAVGLDLEASQREAARLEVDAIQLERGERATEFEPRQPIESFVETDAGGNLFRDTVAGATVRVRACNYSNEAHTLRGKLTATDFYDKLVKVESVELALAAGTAAEREIPRVNAGRQGFFRVNWDRGDWEQSLRCAVLEPAPAGLKDSPFGFNHAYPWDFLVGHARDAGVVWWRDWSAKWQTVEPQQGEWDFGIADEQIRRVLQLDCQVEVLLPFPSSSWSTSAREEVIRKAAPLRGYLRSRLQVAFAPQNLEDFANYAAEVVRRYRSEQPHAVTHYQILNEPIYTNYALPREFGYALDDYLKLLEVSYRAMKQADPACRVVGGISANPRSSLVGDFVKQGGLRWVDVVDLHLYDPPRPMDSYEETFRTYAELMQAHGGAKPVWITEWGCYADDDPPSMPHTVGDQTMNRCRWPSERAATEHIVKFAAVSFAHGVRKLFFHAGTCGPINGSDAGGVLFEYGGTPRKMYAGVAVLTRLLGVPDECVQKSVRGSQRVYVFRTGGRYVAVAWQEAADERPLKLAPQVTAFDIMGNELPADRVSLTASPIYLAAPHAEALGASASFSAR